MSKNWYVQKIGEKAKLAALHLSNVSIEKRNSVLKQFSQYLSWINGKKRFLLFYLFFPYMNFFSFLYFY